MSYYQLQPYTAPLCVAAAAFNARLASASARRGALFTLPEAVPPGGRQEWQLLTDSDGEVRGGVILQRERCLVGGAVREVVNLQSPITEGAVDRAHAAAGPTLVRGVLKQTPLAYAVGMGSLSSPLARLLLGMRWQVGLVPFLARAFHPRRVVETFLSGRQLPAPASIIPPGLMSLAGGLALWVRQRSMELRHGGGGGIPSRPGWPAGRDELWDRIARGIGFAFCRDEAGLELAYPISDTRLQVLSVETDRGTGWAVLTVGHLPDSVHFGALRVAAIFDMMADPGLRATLVRGLIRHARAEGADVCVANFTHEPLVSALKRSGFVSLPSNYVLALSPDLATQVAGRPVHVSRGDGDGRIHLLPAPEAA